MFLKDFARVLSIPDHAVLSEILAVREENTYQIYTKDLADKIPGSVWFPTFEEMVQYTMERACPGDLILTLGGGDIYKCADLLVEKYRELLSPLIYKKSKRRFGTNAAPETSFFVCSFEGLHKIA